MEQLCRRISGQALLNGLRFSEAVFTLPQTTFRREKLAEKTLLVFEDGTAFSFSCATVQDDKPINMLTAVDVTREYSRTQALHERKHQVEQLNERMVSYQQEVLALIASQEVLNAKVKIHNELGASLLATRHLLLRGKEEEKDALLQMIRQNLSFLKQDAQPAVKDEYRLILSTVRDLGLEVEVSGELPQTEPLKHITATAIHECCTNTIRHANGSKVRIRSSMDENRYCIECTNNGQPPAAPIAEKGGLSSLRRLTEHAGGSMSITLTPDFHLTLILPKEGNADGR